MKKFGRWLSDVFSWYGDLILIGGIVLLVLSGILVGVVWSSNDYNSRVERCNELGGVYLKGQCMEGKVIKL